ncbi:MAG: 3-deoxy-D-manno-octulosonic acid transferase [Thalassovita sp.]
MARSLSLAAYMALARRAPRENLSFTAERPEGELLWAHAPTLSKAAALQQLFERLEVQRPGVHLLLTTAPELPQPDHLSASISWQPIPEESVGSLGRFLDHWRPNFCLWTSGVLRPAAIELTARAGIPLYLVDAEATALEEARFRWLPDMSRGVLKRFKRIFANDRAAAQRLGRIGIGLSQVSVPGPIQEGRAALPCDEAARDELASALAGRPIWLAAMAQMDEIGMISQAHQASMRMAHRQLLVLVPDNVEQGPDMAAKLRQWGWNVAVWSEGDFPDETTQIILADTRGEMGLWYRLAPITLMASSLVSGYGGADPYEPAALGSAILYGPNVGRHLSAYGRFANAGAARMVRNADTLASAISILSAPDQAATMARAGWEVSSAGAEVTDALIEMIQDELDSVGVS